jgi:hypothetical protein
MTHPVNTPANDSLSAGSVRRSGTMGDDRLAGWAPSISVATIWLTTLAAAVFSPDLITGSQQEHLPLVGILGWLWAAVATGYVLMVGRGGSSYRAGIPGFVFGLVAVWIAMALASIFAPPMVTGTDPTQIPLIAIVVPIAAMAVTGFICLHAAGTPRSPT